MTAQSGENLYEILLISYLMNEVYIYWSLSLQLCITIDGFRIFSLQLMAFPRTINAKFSNAKEIDAIGAFTSLANVLFSSIKRQNNYIVVSALMIRSLKCHCFRYYICRNVHPIAKCMVNLSIAQVYYYWMDNLNLKMGSSMTSSRKLNGKQQ